MCVCVCICVCDYVCVSNVVWEGPGRVFSFVFSGVDQGIVNTSGTGQTKKPSRRREQTEYVFGVTGVCVRVCGVCIDPSYTIIHLCYRSIYLSIYIYLLVGRMQEQASARE